MDSISWTSDSSVVITSPYDLSLQNVGTDDKSLVDAYPQWSAGAITVPGSNVGSDDDQVHLFPLGLGNTLTDTESLTQSVSA